MRLTFVVGLVVIDLAGAAPCGLAQSRATGADLRGVVVDELDAVVPGATVTATNAGTGIANSAVTGRDGRYVIPGLAPGTYVVRTSLEGFSNTVVENVSLTLGGTAELDLTLAVGRTTASVTVTASPALADAHRTALATVVSQRQIDNLPTNGRDFLSFSVITPVVNTDRTPQQGASAASGLTFAGQRARSNNIMVDGLDDNDTSTGSVRAKFSQEAVQEFQVIANSYSAEFGKASGGIVNIVTKSGTNRLSGNLFSFFRDDALNAKEHFETLRPDGNRIDPAQPKAPYRQLQFGGILGGPIRRDRSFFFLSAERVRVRANNFVNIDNILADILRARDVPVEIGDVPYRVEADQILAKVDTAFSPAHRLTIRFNWATMLDENGEPWGGQVARSRGAYLDGRDVMGAALLRSFFSPHSFNELRLQLANRDQTVISLDPACAGVCDRDDEGGPAVDIGPVKVGRQSMTPQPRDFRLCQLVDTLGYDMGRHYLKTGFDVSRVDFRSLALPMYFGGSYVFQQLQQIGLSDVEAFALGLPVAYTQGYGNPSTSGVFSDLSLFAEDEWHVREHLTLKLGVRYQKQFWPKMTETVGDLTYDRPADNNNVAPRLGASWNPGGSGKLTVHGAYGIFHSNEVTAAQTVPLILSGTADHVRIRTVTYPRSVAAWNAPGRKLPEPTTPYPSPPVTIDPRLKTPYAHHVSIGLERTLRGAVTMSTDFVYVRGFDQIGSIEYNPVTNPATGARPMDVNGPGTSGSVWQYTSWAQSWYRALTFSLRKRFRGRSEFLASYTLSKAEDLAADYAFGLPQENGFGRNPADPLGLPLGFDPMLERGPSLQDQRHRFVASGVFAMPRDITVSGIVTIGSGRPFNIVAGTDLNHDGDRLMSDRPWRVKDDLTTRIGRNAGVLPGTSAVDVRVSRRIALGSRAKLDLMADMFNLLNHTNYTQVKAVFGTDPYPDHPRADFGQFTKAGPPFQVQLGAKISF